MKKVLTAALFAILLVSCATFPEPSEKSSTLLVVDREFRGGNNVSPYVTYFLIFDNDASTMVSLPASNKIAASDALEPGRHKLTTVKIQLLESGGTEAFDFSDKNIIVDMKDGEVTVFPYTFKVRIEAESPVQYWQSWGLYPLMSDRLRGVHDQVMEHPEAMLWEPYKSGNY